MNKYKNKKQITITIDKDLYDKFLSYCNNTEQKRARVINKLIKEYLDKSTKLIKGEDNGSI